jgi:hypothetical protein
LPSIFIVLPVFIASMSLVSMSGFSTNALILSGSNCGADCHRGFRTLAEG